MAYKVFFDANILLDFFLKREGNKGGTVKVFRLIDEGKILPYVNISILQICIYYLERTYGINTTKQILERLLNSFTIIHGDKLTVLHALKSDHTDIEDAIHFFMALENGMDAIVTSDVKFIKYSSPSLLILKSEDLILKILEAN